MTTLSIYPKFGDKTAKITGTVSAGEHVDVRIVGGASLLPSSTLRLRITTCGKTIAVFPQPESNDAWATEGSDLKCHLNLNTVQAEIALRHGCVSCHALLEQNADDEHTLEPTLFFDDEFDILPWRKIPGETTPFNLDAYPDVIASFERRLNEFGVVVNQTNDLVTQAKNAAVGANNRAGFAADMALEAQKSAQAAQRALDGINGQVEDAQRAASAAGEAAETATEKAAEARDAAIAAEEKADEAAASASEAVEKVDSHAERTDNPHGVTKAQVGLGNVDNTADVDKPVSTSQRAAIDAAESAARTAVQNEKSRADLVERNLRTDLTREITRATNAEAGLESSKQNRLSDIQLAAVNSGIDATKVSQIAGNVLAISAERTRAMGAEAVLRAAIEAIGVMDVVIADVLPEPSEAYRRKLYLIPSMNPETRNVKDEFICVKIEDVWSWEHVGSTAITIEFDDEPTEGSQKAARSGGIWAWVKRLVTGKLAAKPLPKYLYELSFDDTYDGDAQAFYNSLSQNPVGGCSAVRKGQKIGRHYDWKYSEAPEFVVRVSAADGRHASVGVASVGSLLTEQMVMSGEYQSLYRVLPGMTLDGINDAHLVCEINVIPRDPSKDPEYDETEGRTMHPLAVVRYALDHFATALEAAQYISAHYYIPENSADSYHWSVSDPSASYVIEDGTYSLCEDATPILTNHRVITTDIYGSGYTRDGLLVQSGTLEEILPQVAFTNAYADGWPWPDEFAGQEDEQGKIPYDATSRLEAWADEHITPLLDPVTRKPAARGNGCWQTVHSSIYNLTKGTLSIAVQEDFAHRFVFAVGGAKVELDGEVTEESENGVKSSGIWSFVKGIIENLTLGWDKITGKPTTFPPTAHGHSADVITGLAQVATTGSYNSLTDKPSIPTVPTKLSEFQNDSGFITDTDAATVVKLTNRNETMADILARLTLAKTEGRYPFFDPSAFAVNPVVKLVSIDINVTDGSVRIQDVATGRIFIGSYVAAETIGDVLSRMVKRYCDILVTATRKDGETVSDVNVYLYEGTDDTGRLVETKAYSGSPVTFRFVEGEPYFIKMDNIAGLFNPTTASGIANIVNEVGIIYGDADHITTFEDIKMALVALGTVEAAKEKLIGKVIADTWVDLDGSGSGDATPSQDAAGHPIWLDPMICTNVEMAEGADGNQHLTAIMMRQYATVKKIQFDPRNHDEATEEFAQAGITYYGSTTAGPTSTSAVTVLSLAPGDPVPYSSYTKVYRNSVNDSTKYVVIRGYNRYQYSAWRQYLNASKMAGKGTWWTKQRVGQVAPNDGDYNVHPYQAGCSDALLAAIKPIKRTVKGNTKTDGGDVYQVCDSLWLPANVEMFGTTTETEGSTQEEYWHFISGDSTKTPSTSAWTPRIQNTVAGKSSAVSVWLRSAYAAVSYTAYYVPTSGSITNNGNGAYHPYAGVPACAIY